MKSLSEKVESQRMGSLLTHLPVLAGEVGETIHGNEGSVSLKGKDEESCP